LEYKPYRQKDGALLAIGALCDKLKQTDPYKSELERKLVQHVFPEFSSPAGHLRAKVHCSFSSFFFEIIFCLAFYILAIPRCYWLWFFNVNCVSQIAKSIC
jgi:hypothetical protein